MSDIDPQWTKKVGLGSRLQDPLELNTVRNRILRHLLYNIKSVAITQRLRYISFSLWCIDNLDNPTEEDLVPFEKIFLLSNLAHEHDGGNKREEKGFSGKSNVRWSKEELKESSGKKISLSREKWVIQKENFSAFSNYYQTMLDSLLLKGKKFNLTPLGQKIAKAFDHSLSVKFKELKKAVKKEVVSSELLNEFSSKGCCCKISEKEKELLKKAYFCSIEPSLDLKNLKFTSISNTSSFDLKSLLSRENLNDLNIDEDSDKILERFLSEQQGPKIRESLSLFLWIAAQQDNNSYKHISNWHGNQDIKELWKTTVYYDYFIYSCESLLFSISSLLQSRNRIHPEKLLSEIVEDEYFRKTIYKTLNSIKTGEEQNSRDLDTIFQYIYYGKPPVETKVEFEATKNKFKGSWSDLEEDIENKIDLSKFSPKDKITEWKIKNLINQEIKKSPENYVKSSSRIFGYNAVLLALLELRYDQFFSEDKYSLYWEWISKVEDSDVGPNKIIKSIEKNDKVDLEEFIKDFSHEKVIQRHNQAIYNKMGPSKMPRIFSKDSEGRIDLQRPKYLKRWSSSLSDLKFKRMLDILYELGLVKSADFGNFRATEEGKELLNELRRI